MGSLQIITEEEEEEEEEEDLWFRPFSCSLNTSWKYPDLYK